MIFPFKITDININPNTNTNNSHNRDKMNPERERERERERENEVVRWKNMEKARQLEVQMMAGSEGLQVN